MRAPVSILLGAVLAACGGTSSAPVPVQTPEALTPASPDVAATPAPAKPTYPATRRDDIVDEIHGVKVADPYRWLEDATSPEVQAWMKAQNDFTRAYLDALPRREQLAKRIAELSYFDASDAPVQKAGRLFWKRKHKDKEKGIVYWKQGDGGAEKVLFDPNTWSADGTTALGDWSVSPNGRYVAYGVKENNSDEAVLHVYDVTEGKELGDVIPGAKYHGVEWTPDNRGFYYTWVPQVSARVSVADRPGFAEVRYHRLGSNPTKDAIAFPATGDPKTFVSATVSDDGRWLLASVAHGWTSTDLYLKDRTRKGARWQSVIKSSDTVYEIEAGGGRFYALTNDGAPRGRVLAFDPKSPARKDWKEVIPEGDTAMEWSDNDSSGLVIAGGHLVITRLRNATSEIELHKLTGGLAHKLAIPPLGKVTHVHGSFQEDAVYFQYSSFTEQSIIFKASAASGAVTEWDRAKLPFDASQIETEQVRYRSKDGTEVPMFIVHKKGAARNGRNATILWGYGGFSSPMLPSPVAGSWQWPLAAWLELGGVIAVPNLRGGNEFGEAWHEAGMLLKKQNVFDDFIAAARYLVAEKWTSPANLAAMGRSNGGLLVGAAMTQAPELFKAVICGVPLLDMVRYHQFGSGKTWISEYGSAEDPEQFKAIIGYSPYQRVKEGVAYPALLMMSADNDDRVDTNHARKFAAAIQHATSSSAPALLRIEYHAGHSGGDQVKATVAGGTDAFAFLAQQLGL